MTSNTIANLPRISSTSLSQIILSAQSSPSNLDAQTAPSHIAIVDVRDDDHIGGHIRDSIHAPSATLDHAIPELVRKLKGKEVVVFHCALSQQRGPGAAMRYVRERERVLGGAGGSGGRGVGGGGGLKRGEVDGEQGVGNEKEEEEVEDGVGNEKEEERKEQNVYVLDRGFVGWQERYGEDSRLTEGYRKEIWKDGYWM